MYPKGVDFQSLELNVIDQREPRKRELNPRFIHFEARPLPKAWHRALPKAKVIDLLLACRESGLVAPRHVSKAAYTFFFLIFIYLTTLGLRCACRIFDIRCGMWDAF